MQTAEKYVETMLAEAPGEDWLRDVARELLRALEAKPLEAFMAAWNLSASEAAAAFGVSRQAFSKWLTGGVPADRAAAVADLTAATELLRAHLKPERIPAVVRREARNLGGRSLYQLACAGGHGEVYAAVQAMFDLRRVQP